MTVNHFKTHRIDHLSASSINLFIADPALYMLKVAGNYPDPGPAAWRGTAVDKIAFAAAQNDRPSEHDLRQIALREYNKKVQFSMPGLASSEKIDSERNDITKYVASAYQFYGDLAGEPESEQGKITIQIGDLPIPFIGFYDLLYPHAVRDCKTVGRMVSSLTYAHARQGAIYSVGTGRPAYIDYIGKRGTATFEVKNPAIYIEQIYRAAKAIELALSRSSDIEVCAQAFYPNLDHWLWDSESIMLAEGIWNMSEKTIEAKRISE